LRGEVLERVAFLLDYSFAATKKNWKAVVLYAGLFTLLLLLSFLPIVSPVADAVLSLISIQIMVYYGRPILERLSKEELLSFLDSSTVKKIYTEKVEVSAGIFLASFVISVLLVLLFFALVLLAGVPLFGEVSDEEVPLVLVRFLIALALFSIPAGWLFFVYPIAWGYAMSKETFGEAFFATFKVFSPSFWKRALSLRYFLFVSLSAILVMVFSFIGLVFLFTLVLFPVGIALLYMLTVFMGGFCAESYAMTGGEELPSREEVTGESRSLS